jgi:hypothetical protein
MPKMRLGWYAGASTALAGTVVLSAFYQRANFYSAMVYLAQSNFCLLVSGSTIPRSMPSPSFDTGLMIYRSWSTLRYSPTVALSTA